MKFSIRKIFLLQIIFIISSSLAEYKSPLVVITWDYFEATEKAWQTIYEEKRSSLDTIEESCSLCESLQCRTTVGFGGSPDESGETTLDALIMDGVKMDVGGVGLLRNVKNAISVARKVLENTEHSLLAGELAADFAVQLGFKNESLETTKSINMWQKWKNRNCQPNFWKNVMPDSSKTCGPYKPTKDDVPLKKRKNLPVWNEENHDTIGVIAMDTKGHIAAGTSTNGAKYKIPGRIGDSPIAGAGAYADTKVGAAAATGAGDIMMRFLPSFLAVEEMRRGATPKEAATIAVKRIAEYYPKFSGAVIALDKDGNYGAACNGLDSNEFPNGFPYYVVNKKFGKPTLNYESCIDSYMPFVHQIL